MKYKLDPVLVKTFIVMLIVINVVYFIRVGFDILGTGIIMKETSPDGQYEVVVSKEKYQGIFWGFADDVSTFELYEKKSGKLISNFENEIRIFGQSYPEVSFKWYEDGVRIHIVGDKWYGDEWVSYTLPYNQS